MYVIQLFLLWRIKRINTNPNLIYTLTPFKKKKEGKKREKEKKKMLAGGSRFFLGVFLSHRLFFFKKSRP
jgi:hypothetical protein